MKNILNKKLNKKGFTLAELLIVVAIIAILVAIAMPLFFGALDKAQKATDDANVRAARAVAVNEILSNWEEYKFANSTDGVNKDTTAKTDDAKLWVVYATVNENGDISITKICSVSDEKKKDNFKEPEISDNKDGGKNIVLSLNEAEITK